MASLLPIEEWVNCPIYKGIPVARLRKILAELPDDAFISGNRVMNLLVTDADKETRLGFIDVLSEDYEPFE